MSIYAVNVTAARAAEDQAFHARYFLDRITRWRGLDVRGGYTIEEMEDIASEHQRESARYYAVDRAERGLTIGD